MAKITEQTKYNSKNLITFRPRNQNDADYVRFVKGNGCSSAVGKSGGEQVIKHSNETL